MYHGDNLNAYKLFSTKSEFIMQKTVRLTFIPNHNGLCRWHY